MLQIYNSKRDCVKLGDDNFYGGTRFKTAEYIKSIAIYCNTVCSI